MWPFKKKGPVLAAATLYGRWFKPQVPEPHPTLESYEAAITEEELLRLPKRLAKLAHDGVERIFPRPPSTTSTPTARASSSWDELLDAEMRWKLTQDQDPNFPRNLFRLVCTEFGCVVGEIYRRAGLGEWACVRAPNHWRSTITLEKR